MTTACSRQAGHCLARSAPSGVVLFMGAIAVVELVTAVLNLDTSEAFLAPVFVCVQPTAKAEAKARDR
jgi:Na+/H+ antiporter NhaD/arsenite permease-like protein